MVFDPIDGSEILVRGVPTWGSMVAVVEGDTILAVRSTCRAKRNGRRRKEEGVFGTANGVASPNKAILAASTVLTTEIRAITNDFVRLAQRSSVARTWGDCYGYVLVATDARRRCSIPN